jgi:hypothetical protein
VTYPSFEVQTFSARSLKKELTVAGCWRILKFCLKVDDIYVHSCKYCPKFKLQNVSNLLPNKEKKGGTKQI